MLKATRKNCPIGRLQILEWFFRFKKGEMAFDDGSRYVRPSAVRSDEMFEKIHAVYLKIRSCGGNVGPILFLYVDVYFIVSTCMQCKIFIFQKKYINEFILNVILKWRQDRIRNIYLYF